MIMLAIVSISCLVTNFSELQSSIIRHCS